MYLMGVDVGSSGSKAAVFSLDGKMLAFYKESYNILHPSKGAIELDPNRVLGAVYKCIDECSQQVDVSAVAALAVSTQGEAVVPVDKAGNALMNVALTFDSRNQTEYLCLAEKIDRAEVMRQTGMPGHPMFSATKIAWIKNNYPDIYKKTWKFMCFGDFIAYKLGAEPAIDYAMAARTMLFDIHQKNWAANMLELCAIDRAKMPQVVPTGHKIGFAGKELQQRGISSSAVILAGSHDQLCCALGAGVLNSGRAMVSLGTTESIVSISDRLIFKEKLLDSNVPVYPYPAPGTYAYMTFLTCCASLLEWMRQKILRDTGADFYKRYDSTVLSTPPSRLYVRPTFAGAGTPSLDFSAKGILYGLTLDTDSAQIYKGILEGICYESKRNISVMEECGIPIEELRCIGGGAKSNEWLQLKADITGKTVIRMDVDEAGCLGAAMIAGVGTGAIRDYEEAVDIFVRKKQSFLPRYAEKEIYETFYIKYLENMYG